MRRLEAKQGAVPAGPARNRAPGRLQRSAGRALRPARGTEVSGRVRSTRIEPAPTYRKLVGVGAFARARHSRGASSGAPLRSFGKEEAGEQVARHGVSPGCRALALAGYLTIESVVRRVGICSVPAQASLPAQAYAGHDKLGGRHDTRKNATPCCMVIYGNAGNGNRQNINKLLIDDRRGHLRRLGHLWRRHQTLRLVMAGLVPAISLTQARLRDDNRDHRDAPRRGGPVMTGERAAREGHL
jgi:hypothetical protein